MIRKVQQWELLHVAKNNIRLPKSCAVVLAVKDRPLTSLGHTQTVNLIKRLETANELLDSSTQNKNDVNFEGNYCRTPYFQIRASEEVSVDTVEISIESAELTIIGDINGRNIPLLRDDLDNA